MRWWVVVVLSSSDKLSASDYFSLWSSTTSSVTVTQVLLVYASRTGWAEIIRISFVFLLVSFDYKILVFYLGTTETAVLRSLTKWLLRIIWSISASVNTRWPHWVKSVWREGSRTMKRSPKFLLISVRRACRLFLFRTAILSRCLCAHFSSEMRYKMYSLKQSFCRRCNSATAV